MRGRAPDVVAAACVRRIIDVEEDRHDGNRLVAEQPFDNEAVSVTETRLERILNPGTQFATGV
jgi:hypothetical protein